MSTREILTRIRGAVGRERAAVWEWGPRPAALPVWTGLVRPAPAASAAIQQAPAASRPREAEGWFSEPNWWLDVPLRGGRRYG